MGEGGDVAMATQVLILPAGGFVIGLVLGWTFGLIHDTKCALHKSLRRIDEIASGWVALPALFTRSVFLLVMLTFFQVAFTLLFDENGFQWMVSAGVVLGYVWTLVQQFRRKTLSRS
jgi:hypothetical protein